MERLLTSLFLFLTLYSHSQNTLELKGELDKSLYFQNPFAPPQTADSVEYNKNRFCTDSILVNGKKYTGNINNSAFELVFDSLHIHKGDSVNIVLFHKKGCKPRVLVTGGCLPPTTCKVLKYNLSKNGELTWTTAQNKIESFIIEQCQWNSWRKVGEINERKRCDTCEYSYKIPNMHSGENKIRIKVLYWSDLVLCEVSVKSDLPKISYSYQKAADKIIFSSNTSFELFDMFGNSLQHGYSNEIICTDLPKRKRLMLFFDNQVKEIKLK
ncbi:MAG: hypothetical protein NT150_02095 [Bacteroidetes bacterium]|nr:hypothetical protein [Bacteroidota bacterium]